MVGPVDLVEIDVVSPQPFQTRIAPFGDDVWVLICSSELGRDDSIASASRERATENFLRIGIVRISLCGVEKVNAGIERGMNRGDRVVVVLCSPNPATGERPTT